jgi:tRNA pseudouridine38-40 synthase
MAVWYTCIVSYDGTDYFGWQWQPNKPTVVGMLQNRFHSLFKQSIKITGASRTDASVHAYGQVAVFSTDLNIDPLKLMRVWNRALPGDIVIRELILLPQKINPLCGVEEKVYQYHFSTIQPMPFWQRYCYFINRDIDIEKCRAALQIFVGTHDFRSFCTGYEMNSTIRTIKSIDIEFVEEYQCYRIIFKGSGFLRYMIRRIVGASLEASFRDNITIEYLQKVLAMRNARQTLLTAPGHGLCLYKITYKKIEKDKE